MRGCAVYEPSLIGYVSKRQLYETCGVLVVSIFWMFSVCRGSLLDMQTTRIPSMIVAAVDSVVILFKSPMLIMRSKRVSTGNVHPTFPKRNPSRLVSVLRVFRSYPS